MMRIRFAIFATLMALLTTVHTQAQQKTMTQEEQMRAYFTAQYADRILTNANDEIITLDDLRAETRRYNLVIQRESKTQQEFDGKIRKLWNDTMMEMTNTILLVSDYSDSKMAAPEEYIGRNVDAVIAEKIERVFDGDRGKYLSYLRARGSNPAADRKRERDNMVAQWQYQMLAQNAASEVSPSQVYQYYMTNIDAYRRPESLEFAQIVLFAGASESDEMVATAARNLVERLKKNPSAFADDAKVYSRDDYRTAGGYVGWTPVSDLSPLVVERLKSVKNGEVPELLEMKMANGQTMYVVLKRINLREAGAVPLEEVRAQIENQLRFQNQERARMEKMAELRERYFIHNY